MDLPMSKNYESFFLELEGYISEMLEFTDFGLNRYLDALVSMNDHQLISEEDRKKATNLYELSADIRMKLALINEEEIKIEPMYMWNELKLEHTWVKEVGFITPFSYISHWVSFPQLEGLVKNKGFREALFISQEYLAIAKKKHCSK
jgi:hypothetical protein